MLPKKTIYFAVLLAAYGCSVMPADVSKDAMPDMPFTALMEEAGQHIGQTVILGGYVVEVINDAHQSRIIAVHAPLGSSQEPKEKDLSQGRLVITYNGFVDPEVYQKDRKITVAGKIAGSSQTEQGKYPFPYLRIDMTHIHLWPLEKQVPYDPYWDYWGPPYYYRPWGYRHPYWW